MDVKKTSHAVLFAVEGIVYSLGKAYEGVPALDFGTDKDYLPVTVFPPSASSEKIPEHFFEDDVWNTGFLEGTARHAPKVIN